MQWNYIAVFLRSHATPTQRQDATQHFAVPVPSNPSASVFLILYSALLLTNRFDTERKAIYRMKAILGLLYKK